VFAQGLAPVPPLKARVTDLTGTLTATQIASLDQSLAAFERRKGSQIAVLLVPTTKPEEIEQYSIRVADAWKVGRKNADDGAIVVVATADRRARIEVGYGLEGAIPDALAKRVIDEVIIPHFRAGDWYGGIREGTAQLMKLVDGEPLPPPAARPSAGGGGNLQSLLVVLLVVIVAVGGTLKALLGRVVGSVATGGVAGVIALVIAGSLAAAILAGIAAFVFSLVAGAVGGGMAGGRGYGGWGGGPWIGGSGGGGWSSGGGGWSGGGGGFGGGGASGRW